MYLTGEFDGTHELFSVLVAPFLDEMYQRSIDLPKLADLNRCPSSFLQLLAGNINALTVEDSFSEDADIVFRRRELGKMVDIFKIRGNRNSLERILKYMGSIDFGVIIPRETLAILDITPILGARPGETNDVGEDLAPEDFDISNLCDGYLFGNIVKGNRVVYTIPKEIIRSAIKLFWNGTEIPIGRTIPIGSSDREVSYSSTSALNFTTITTNFVPYIGDTLVVRVMGDPYYMKGYRIPDSSYWRPGTVDVWSDEDPTQRTGALMDRRLSGNLLYMTWVQSFYWSRYFVPPNIDYTRSGYSPDLPPDETFNPDDPTAGATPVYATAIALSAGAHGAVGTVVPSIGSVAIIESGVQGSMGTGIVVNASLNLTGVEGSGVAGDPAGGSYLLPPVTGVHGTTGLGVLSIDGDVSEEITGVEGTGDLGSPSVVII